MGHRITVLQTVPGLAAGASSAPIPHGLRDGNGNPLTPNWIFPTDTGSTVVPTAFDAVNVTYINLGANASVPVFFRVAFEHTLVRANSTAQAQFIYSGPSAGGSGSFVGFTNDPLYNQQVYVDLINGNDNNNGLTPATALATKHAADRKFPLVISGNAKLRVNVAGVGGFGSAATAPLSYEEPTLLIGGPGSGAHNGYCLRGADRVPANPTTGPATAVLDAVPVVEIDQANVAAPGSGFRTRFDFTVAAPGWTVNNFRNSRFFLRVRRAGVDVIPETPIVENTANTLTIDIVVTGVGVILATDTVEIVRQSVEFTGPAVDLGKFLIVGHGLGDPFDTISIGTGNGNTIEGIAFVGRPVFRNFFGGLDFCAASGTLVEFYNSSIIFMQCKFQLSFGFFGCQGNYLPGHFRAASLVNPINQGFAFRAALCVVGTMTIGDPRSGPTGYQVDNVLSHYGGSALRVWGPGAALSVAGSGAANILGSGATLVGMWARYGARIIVNPATRTQVIGPGVAALRVGNAAAAIIAYGVGVGAFEEPAGFAGNFYRMDGSVPTAPTGDESQIILASLS